MGIVRVLIWLITLAAFSVAASYAFTVYYVFTYKTAETFPKADVIVVLSGNVSRDGALYGSTTTRVSKGIEAFDAESAPLIVMTGGGEPPAGVDMAAEAIANGVPPNVVLIESRSFSTLQNALFTASLPEIDTDMSIIVVTHRYHLARSWASFRWAGFKNIALVAADPDAEYTLSHSGIKKEAFKWPINVLRGAFAGLIRAVGAPQNAYAWMLY